MYIHKIHTAVFTINAKIDRGYKKKMVSDSSLSGIQSSSIHKRKYFLHPTGKNYFVLKSLTLTNIIKASKKLIVGSDIIHGAVI
jgi:hypothetical protein